MQNGGLQRARDACPLCNFMALKIISDFLIADKSIVLSNLSCFVLHCPMQAMSLTFCHEQFVLLSWRLVSFPHCTVEKTLPADIGNLSCIIYHSSTGGLHPYFGQSHNKFDMGIFLFKKSAQFPHPIDAADYFLD